MPFAGGPNSTGVLFTLELQINPNRSLSGVGSAVGSAVVDGRKRLRRCGCERCDGGPNTNAGGRSDDCS